MAIFRLKIVGVHYAVNADEESVAVETEEMHNRTATRLSEFDRRRPLVVLIPDTTNPVDARAVMAHVEGKRIGYVSKTQLDTVYALFKAAGRQTLIARIDEVNAVKHGWMYVTVQTDEDVLVEPLQPLADEWKGWKCEVPIIAPDESRFACVEAEAVLETLLPANLVAGIDLVEQYIRLWHKNSLHDLSNESRLTREHYITVLKEGLKEVSPDAMLVSRIEALVVALEKQRTAICGNKRMHLRIGVWWKQLMTSKEMQLLWDSWTGRMEGDMERSKGELDALLRTLPFDLYGLVNHKGLFFSRLHYNHVPRKTFHEIVSVMLLYERTLMEMQNGVEEGCHETLPPLKKEEEEDKFVVVIPQELQTPEAKKILAILQKKGYLDKDLQPSKLVGWQKGELAYVLCERLGIVRKWNVMATLWKCHSGTLRTNYSKNFTEQKAIDFSKELKSLIF